MATYHRSPLYITPIHSVQQDEKVTRRFVSQSETGGETNVCFHETEKSRRALVAGANKVHYSMELDGESVVLNLSDISSEKNNNIACWTRFRDMDQQVLCILASPTQVKMFDVYSGSSFLGGGEGFSIHLPCQARSIFCLKQGLLIQRKISPEDEDDDPLQSNPDSADASTVSVFSLAHPLDPVLPISGGYIFEQIISVSSLSDRQLCVTYNVKLRRHALWSLENAPLPPPPTPLWQINHSDDVHRVEVDSDLLPTEDHSVYDGVTSRQEALADALGVRRPRTNPLITTTPSVPLQSLYPQFSMVLVYELIREHKEATLIFPIESALCLLCSGRLHVLALAEPVRLVAKIPCRSAVPLHNDNFLLLTPESNLRLYQMERFLVDCAWPGQEQILSLEHAVGYSFELITSSRPRKRFRCRLSLDFPSSPLAQCVLSTMDKVLDEDMATAIRIDSLRLSQQLDQKEQGDAAWSSVSDILSYLLNHERNAPSLPTTRDANKSPWEALLLSEFHGQYDDEVGDDYLPSLPEITGRSSETNSLASVQPISAKVLGESRSPLVVQKMIFDTLHLLYEDSKMALSSNQWVKPLGKLLIQICALYNMDDFMDHYGRDLGSKEIARSPHRSRQSLTSFSRPPCIRSWIDHRMKDPSFIGDFPVSTVFGRTRLIHRIYSKVFPPTEGMSPHPNAEAAAVKILLEEGITDPSTLQEDFPIGVALPLIELLNRCQSDPNVLGHNNQVPTQAWRLIGREDIGFQLSQEGKKLAEIKANIDDEDKDGLVPLETTAAMFFPSDNRLHEVCRLLRSSRPIFLKVPRPVEATDHDFERLKQERLLVFSRRTLALPLGRGMLTIGSLNPIAAESLPIPSLCLSGRVPPTNNPLALDTSSCPTNMRLWPDFHNGVSAGLRLPRADVSSGSEGLKISRSWIVYNRNSSSEGETNAQDDTQTNQPNDAHGGLLMALGLRGHLSVLSMTDIFEYLTQGSVTTSVGVLLGMAANKRGSCDPAVSKMLCLHIPSLLPASFSTIDVPGPVQAAAVTGIGLLYQGSSHRLMTEFLLNEMARRPVHDANSVDREAYTLACGLALGMVNLAQGESRGGGSAGLADLEIDLRLHRYVVGGVDSRVDRRHQDAADRLLNINGDIVNEERCSRIFEGGAVNNDLTAPGATLALGLIHLKSGNKAIASALQLPDTHFLMEYVRPDFLMLRVIARAMILWDQVKPSSKWIDNQIPGVVRATFRKMRIASHKAANLPVPDEEDENEDMGVANQGGGSAREKLTQLDGDVDRQAIRQIHSYVIAGACFGIGLRFAGTADKEAAVAIREKLVSLKGFRDDNDIVTAALRPDQPVVEMCLGLCAISLGMVMAGTGDLDALRLFKQLRWRCDEETRYGTHMAIGAAIGLLFLGGGACTLGRTNEDIAALVNAFFPRFPSKISDNQYHLQALRHLYVSAVCERGIQAMDIDTLESVSAEIELEFESQKIVAATRKTTPCLLLNSDEIPKRLHVCSNIYFESTFDFRSLYSRSGVKIFVKKRNGSGTNQAGSMLNSLPHENGGGAGKLVEGIRSVRNNARLICFAEYFCNEHADQCHTVLRESLARESEGALLLFSALYNALKPTQARNLAWEIRLLRTYFQSLKGNSGILSAELIGQMVETIENAFARESLNHSLLEGSTMMGPMLVWYDVPLVAGDHH